MNHRYPIMLVAATLLLGGGLASVATAQDEEDTGASQTDATEAEREEVAPGDEAAAAEQDSQDGVFDEITVTAKKREESAYDVPVAITAFEGEDLKKRGIIDIVDIGKFVPNLNITQFSAGHNSSVNSFIRGIGLQDHLVTTDPGVAVYVDGVYLGRQIGQNWNLSNVERVEVLRGPQGTLYGRNTIGGAINIITRKPGTEELSQVTFEAGTRERWGADFYTNQQLNETWAVSVTGSYTRRDGLGSFLNLPNADVEVGQLEEIAARVAVQWQPSDRLSILLSADANNGDGGLRPYTTLIDEVPNGAVFGAGFRNSDTSANPYDNNTGNIDQTRVLNEADGVAVTADWKATDNLNVRLLLSDRHSEYESGLDDDSFFENFLAFPETGFADQTSGELQLSGDYGKWDFVSGLYYFEEDGENDQRPTVFLGGPGTFTLGQEIESTAVYGNVGYELSDRTRISGGLRFTNDDKFARVNLNDSLIDTSESDDWSETSGEIAITHELPNELNLYGAIQSGYQSGQFPARPFCLFGFLDEDANLVEPNCFLASDPVTAINYEVGVKGRLFPNLLMSVALFYTQYSDLPYQVSTTQGAGFDTRNIIVDQDSVGIEWEGSWYLGNGLFLHSSLGYIDVDVKDPSAVAPLTPEFTAAFSPEYTRAVANGGKVGLRLDYSFRDDMYGEPTPDPGRFTRIDSRDLINVDVAYTAPGGGWSLGLYGRNVTDERYDNARLNTGDYILVMLSNDASEFGVRYTTRF